MLLPVACLVSAPTGRSSLEVEVVLLALLFQYQIICAASTALRAKPATKPYRMSGSGTSCRVVKMRLREPRR